MVPGSLDIRELGAPFLGVKHQREATERANVEANERTQETGHRIREQLRPLALEVRDAFDQGQFMTPQLVKLLGAPEGPLIGVHGLAR